MSFKDAKPLTKCPHCGGVVDIGFAGYVQTLIVHINTLKEELNLTSQHCRFVHLSKNGIIQALHKKIGKMVELMTPEQIEKLKEINQAFRDEIRFTEKVVKK